MLPLAPSRASAGSPTRAQDAAVAELCDPAVLRARLAALHRAYDEGEIDDEQFEAEEERLLDLLDRARSPGGRRRLTPRKAAR